MIIRNVRNVFNDIFFKYHDWRIAIKKKASINETIPEKWGRFKEIRGTNEYSFADPLLFEDKRGEFLFVEAINRKTKRGCIGVIDLSNNKFSPIIIEDFHMSFPFVFCDNGETYMIPETNEAEKLILYRAINYPYEWERYSVLMDDVKLTDTVVYKSSYDNSIKLITTKKNCDDEYFFQLYDFELKNLTLKEIFQLRDSERENRNAGQVLFDNKTNKNYRVTQNSNGLYGKNLVFWEILNDSKTYSQKKIKSVLPSEVHIKGINGKKIKQLHTYSVSSKYECIDFGFSGYSFRYAYYWFCDFLNRKKK